jgi:hypothetical protein
LPEPRFEDDGPFGAGPLLRTLAEYGGSGDDADQPDYVRFARNVTKLIRKRLAQDPLGPSDEPAVFLLSAVPSGLLTAEPERFPMLDNGLTPLEGRIWFVGPVASLGSCIDAAGGTDDDLFRQVTDALGLGSIPAVVAIQLE